MRDWPFKPNEPVRDWLDGRATRVSIEGLSGA
jgi:hypothetical protein